MILLLCEYSWQLCAKSWKTGKMGSNTYKRTSASVIGCCGSSEQSLSSKKTEQDSFPLCLIFFVTICCFIVKFDTYSSSEPLFFLTKITAPNTLNRIQIPMMIMIVGFHASLLALSTFDAGIVVLSSAFPLSFAGFMLS